MDRLAKQLLCVVEEREMSIIPSFYFYFFFIFFSTLLFLLFSLSSSLSSAATHTSLPHPYLLHQRTDARYARLHCSSSSHRFSNSSSPSPPTRLGVPTPVRMKDPQRGGASAPERPALVLRRRLTVAARACAPTQLAVASAEGHARAPSRTARAAVAPCPRTRKKKARASTAKYTMGPRAPDKEPVGAIFGSTCQNRAVRARFPAAPCEEPSLWTHFGNRS